MSIADAYESGEHSSNLAHFAAIVKLATVDGPINEEESEVLKKLAFKLDVSKDEFKQILKNPNQHPLIPPYTLEKRIERIRDLFKTIYADNIIDEKERKLIYRYAIGLGFSNGRAREEIEKCIQVFEGNLEFED